MAIMPLGFSIVGLADAGSWTQGWTKLNAVDFLR